MAARSCYCCAHRDVCGCWDRIELPRCAEGRIGPLMQALAEDFGAACDDFQHDALAPAAMPLRDVVLAAAPDPTLRDRAARVFSWWERMF